MSVSIENRSIETIRFLAVDSVQAANSGHPGMPMGMAPTAYSLFTRIMKHNPSDPRWLNRDRFVLSAGHGSMLLYSMLYLCGYDMDLDDLKQFRQWGSKTPGHPEYDPDLGIEVTTGPLGQGLSNGVGMAIAQKYLAARFNKDGFNLFDYNIYVINGDGCLEEGISHEACSLAGHLGLDNLVLIYDDNHITIDGNTALSFTEDVAARFRAYHWNVIEIDGDGTDRDAIEKAVKAAQAQDARPTLVKLKTIIGFGSPNKQGTHSVHGAALGEEEVKLTKKAFGWDPEKSFVVPEEVLAHMRQCVERGQAAQAEWEQLFATYSKKYPELAREIKTAQAGQLPVNLDDLLPGFEAGSAMATRKASGLTLGAVMPSLPLMVGGSADLTPSNNTWFDGATDFQKDCRSGRYIRYGVREHAMAAVMNGIAVSGLVRPYGGTFMVFTDYMRGAMRVASISNYPTIFVLTHDSIGVGEDGPTHQPVEHAAALRAIPNMRVFRPADAHETAYCWKYVLEHADAPACLCLTRQNLPVMDAAQYPIAEGVAKGAYILVKQDKPDVLLLATGSEVSLALEAADKLATDGVKAQVVSMPCWELFAQQSQAYQDEVLPPGCTARVGVEAGVEQGWFKWLGLKGRFVGMRSFGSSGPFKACFENFGITTDAVVAAAKQVMA